MRRTKYANVLFHQNFLEIGGVETYEYEFIWKYHNLGYDLDLFYCRGSRRQLERIADIIGWEHVHEYHGEIVNCHTLFVNYDFDAIIDNVFADRIVNVSHANFWLQKNYRIKTHPKITDYVGVSDSVCDGHRKRTRSRIEISTCYNPMSLREGDEDDVLILVSATRLTAEKGKDRMIELMNALDKANVRYLWLVFTNDRNAIANPNVIYMKPRLDIRPYLKMASYTVQLSDSEGWCYTVMESLCLGTPAIVSDLETFREMGVRDGYNGYILPLDMKTIPVEKIAESRLEFAYTPKSDRYDEYLYRGKTEEKEIEMDKIRIIRPFFDMASKVHYVPLYQAQMYPHSVKDGYPNVPFGIVEMETPRASVLVENGYAEYVDKPAPKKRKKRNDRKA